MSYIGRFFKWMARGAIHLVKELIMFAIRQVISVIRFAVPYIYQIVISVLGLMLQMSVMNLLALVRPIPDVARSVGEAWSEQFVVDGLGPSLHQPTITKIFTVVAYIAMTVGLLVNLFFVIFTSILAYQSLIAP
jgi:hypothetical protein